MGKKYEELGVTAWGDYNTAPEPMVECDANDFWGALHEWGMPQDSEHRQVFSNGRFTQNLIIMTFFDEIFALELRYHDGIYTPKFYRIGCEHDFENYTIGRCLHQYICRKCGFQKVIDSSD